MAKGAVNDDGLSSAAAAVEARGPVELNIQTQQQVFHVVGWALYKIAMAMFPKTKECARTPGQQSLCDAVDKIQLPSAQSAMETGCVEYEYSLAIQKVDPTHARAGLRYIKPPIARVFFLVERVCIGHFDPKGVVQDSYMRAQRQGLAYYVKSFYCST